MHIISHYTRGFVYLGLLNLFWAYLRHIDY